MNRVNRPLAARFRGAFPALVTPLAPELPEIAFIGRSNVGKSSLINALVGQRLARTSATPGKTRSLNVYEIHLGRTRDGPAHPSALYVLDLPGYGYARAAKSERRAFRALIRATVQRAQVSGIVWLLDLRRDLGEDDRDTGTALVERGVPVLVALTKCDTVPRSERPAREEAIRDALGMPADQMVLTSARTGDGIPDLRAALAALAARAAPA